MRSAAALLRKRDLIKGFSTRRLIRGMVRRVSRAFSRAGHQLSAKQAQDLQDLADSTAAARRGSGTRRDAILKPERNSVRVVV